jgi:hypothetical protein
LIYTLRIYPLEFWQFPKMHIPLIIISLWVAAVLAYPLRRGAAADIQVLAFADVLEQLESAFYTQAPKHLMLLALTRPVSPRPKS